MQRTEGPTFRPTFSVWPTEVPPGLSVQLSALELRDGFVHVRGDGGDARALPLDFTIREVVETSPHDADAVVRLMNEYGPLVTRSEWTLHEDDVDLLGFPLADATAHLRDVRAMARIWLAGPRPDHEHLREILVSELGDSASTRMLALTPEHVWGSWAVLANRALREFHPFVDVDLPDWTGSPAPQPSLYGASAYQLVQTITEGREMRICANERCERPFTRQRTSRRQYKGTEHATGIKYCSEQCAKAQSERERRRRRKSEGRARQ